MLWPKLFFSMPCLLDLTLPPHKSTLPVHSTCGFNRKQTYTMSDKIVPLISSGTKGPLGVLHLPRLWQKVSLEAAGKIADGYPGIGAGYDSMVIGGLGLNADAVRDYIAGQKPTYPQFEAWIQAQEGAKLDADSVGALNASIEGYNHDDETRQGILSANGLPDGDPKDAINLNNLDDWLEFHAAEIA